jgi:hypothetical protein
MNKKAESFKAMLDELKIAAFTPEELKDDFHTVAFRSNMEIQKQLLPMLVLLDDSIYAMMRVFVAPKVVTEDRKAEMAAYLNEFNKQFKIFKYYISDEGDIVLDCCIASSDEHFDANLVRAVLDVVIQHLNDKYTEIMQHVWGGNKE